MPHGKWGGRWPPRRTENGACRREATNLPRPRNARQARDGWGDGSVWKVYPAGLTRRGTKNHEGSRRKDSQKGPQISQILADLGPATAGRTASVFGNHRAGQRAKPSTAKEGDAGGGPCVRKGARPARRAYRGMAGFARHALVFGSPPAPAPSYMSYASYASYRDVFNQPSFQSANQRGGNAAPCPTVSPVGTSQTCRGCRENFSLPGRGAAPHIFQSSNQLISQSANFLCVPLCPLW